ncbi:MAG: HAMP domain-containing protein [Deltaproteobacteria bacterium]|nr:HAMP domain-containing protein [Deltaproteobacteria bacterium]
MRNRLLLVYLLPTALILGAGGWYAYTSARDGAVEDLSKRLQAIAQATAGPLSAGPDAGRIARLEPGMERVHSNLRRKLLQLRDATGVRRIFVLGPRLEAKVDTREGTKVNDPLPEVIQDRQEIGLALGGTPSSSVLFTSAEGVPCLTGYAPIRLPQAGQVIGVVGVEGSTAFFSSLDRLAVQYGSAGLVLLALLLAVSLVVSRRITRPVSRLAAAAQRIGRGDLESEVRLAGNDELASLARTLNEMRLAIRQREHDLQLMLSGIAHEVRNPLGGMELFTGLLAEEVADQPTAARYTERIRRELIHLERVVNEFLDFARRKPLRLAVCEVEALLSEVVALGSADPVARACTIELSVARPGLRVTVDGRKLRQALLNLLRNACQAMPQGGRVLLCAARQEEELVLSVQDQGPGIPPELRERVLRPFFTTREKGTGLGLALCAKIAADHGGKLELDDAPGGGALVRIHLPLSASATRLAGPITSAGDEPCLDRLPGGGQAGGSDPSGDGDRPLRDGGEHLFGSDEPLIGDDEPPLVAREGHGDEEGLLG